MELPLLRPDVETRAARAIHRAALLARASAWVLVILAGSSTALNAGQPLSAPFLISMLVFGNGVVEWRLARRLGAHDRRALDGLAFNQFALGGEILGYAAWQMQAFSPAEILALLQRPELKPLVEAIPPEQLQSIAAQLPPLVYAAYAIIGIGGAIGCWAIAIYYRSRRKFLSVTTSQAAA